MADRHVTPHPDGWANKKGGAKRATSVHDTQKEAYDAARASSSKQGGGEVSIHGRDGKIREKNTIPPKNDPFPPRG